MVVAVFETLTDPVGLPETLIVASVPLKVGALLDPAGV
jgi:hypothetical protein